MNVIDIVILIPLVYLAYKGFRKGLVLEIFTLLALILGIYSSIHFSGFTFNFLDDTLDLSSSQKEYLPLLSYALTFIAVVVGVHFLGKVIEKLISFAALSLVNKALGSFFGLLKGLVVICALLMLFNPINQHLNMVDKNDLNDSLLYEPISGFLISIGPDLQNNKTFQQMEEGFKNLIPE